MPPTPSTLRSPSGCTRSGDRTRVQRVDMVDAMRLARGLGAAALSVFLLAGCLPNADPAPAPTETVSIDAADAEALLLGILAPAPPAGVTESRSTGLDEETFGDGYGDWNGVEHDALRIARAQGFYESVGWKDPTLGPGFWFVAEMALMESAQAADAAMQDIASAAKENWTVEATDATPMVEYVVPAAPPRADLPFGTVQMELRTTWSTGERANGWIAYLSDGPFVMIVWGVTVPYEGSPEGFNAFADAELPGLVERFGELPEQLAAR